MSITRTRKSQLPKTGWTVPHDGEGFDDGGIQAGSPILPRFIDNGDNTITDRVTNRQWIKQPELIIPDGLRTDNIGQAKGLWAQNTAYSAGDIADKASDYSAWVCLIAHTSIQPADYADATLYAVNDLVYDNPTNTGDGTWYQCGTAHTSSGANIATDTGGGWTQIATDINSLFDFARTQNPTYWQQSVWAGDDGSGNLVPTQMACDNAHAGGGLGATDACHGLTKSGKSDWYLPNRFELESILDLSQVNPAINSTIFPNTRTDNYYWTSSPYAGNPDYYAWIVYFYVGSVYYFSRNDSNYVRPVRQY